ncbi:MAG: acetyl-CoA acetyltransferase [Armatimonadota bacterium]|nr:acetyl-CoA acetyltransferase [Armatimonadota bacterium]MDR7400650.1 acetyl-CoA acetyltransferase [Armatimonadota bacterium]MDR7403178.1 acetyl-CoA acetyltransferase [Armatimonadota bacterium]MDR7436539.1 acetyl-CoA acetyltransferase [Armatimonadota bacterium]MDR7472574.1 acetyl-CoA acetyltransferase [Armatimonadota bacterium]
MTDRVAIVGVGATPPRPVSADRSYREMVFEAASRAYADAGLTAADVDSVVSVAEDFHEGTSITDEYVPDQLGAVLRPVHTVAADGLGGVAAAVALIRSGIADRVVVEAHAKASNVRRPGQVLALALDPIYERLPGISPHYVAGMEMRRYLHETGTPEQAVAMVVVKNRRHALAHPAAAFGALLDPEAVRASLPVCEPLREMHISPAADGAVVLVLASAEAAAHSPRPVWIRGIGWASDTPWLATRGWAQASYAALAAEMAYRMAGMSDPAREIRFAEVDDTYAYKELQHLEAVRLAAPGEAARMVLEGETRRGGRLPVNPSGGSLGLGHCYDASALYRVVEAVRQIRGEAGPVQVAGATVGLVVSWRGIPTQSGGVLVLGAA